MEQGLDPMELPDLETGFSDTILGITWHGSATLRNGQFWSLSTIARSGDTSFTVDNNVTELTAVLSLSSPRAHYDAHAEFISVDIDGLGPLDWILEILVDFIDEFFRDWIKDLVEGLLRSLLQDLLNNFPPDWPLLA